MKRMTLLTTVAALSMLGACGGGDDDDADKSPPAQAAEPSRLAIELTGSAKQPTFSVPASVAGGVVEIELTNSAKGTHGAQLVRAEAGHTPQEALAAASTWAEKGKPLPEWALVVGGVAEVPSGESASVTQELAPGKYLAVDIDTNASAEFEVKGESGQGELAADAGTISATEYAFESEGLKAGEGRVLFENAGGEPHFVAAAPIKQGKTIADVRKWLKTESGPSPIEEGDEISTAVIEGGSRLSVELGLTPGKYAVLCFVPDRAGGPPHAFKGMVSEAVVGG